MESCRDQMVNVLKWSTLNIVQVDSWTRLWYDEISVYGQCNWLLKLLKSKNLMKITLSVTQNNLLFFLKYLSIHFFTFFLIFWTFKKICLLCLRTLGSVFTCMKTIILIVVYEAISFIKKGKAIKAVT